MGAILVNNPKLRELNFTSKTDLDWLLFTLDSLYYVRFVNVQVVF